jgi:hypothetical protein
MRSSGPAAGRPAAQVHALTRRAEDDQQLEGVIAGDIN